MIKTILISLAVVLSIGKDDGKTAQEQLDQAKKNNKVVVMLITDKKSSAKEWEKRIDQVVAKELNLVAVELDSDNPANKELANRFNVEYMKLPVAVIISGSGVVANVIKELPTTQQLSDLIPTPKFGEILGSLSEGRAMFVVVSNDKFANHSKVIKMCMNARRELNDEIDVIIVDSNDKMEGKLLRLLKITDVPKDSHIVVINGDGMISTRFSTLPTQQKLNEAGKATQEKGCAGG